MSNLQDALEKVIVALRKHPLTQGQKEQASDAIRSIESITGVLCDIACPDGA